MKKQVKGIVKKRPKKTDNFFIVGIGASAGGLEAITALLKELPPDTGMAYVYVQHLDPTHKSMLAALLSKLTSMPVIEAVHGVHIEPNHFYVIPPNKDMRFIDGHLMLRPRAARPVIHLPINEFFISLAENKSFAIGVVLSGNASDGAAGLKAIKIAGGFTFAQDDSAKFQSMPKSAVAERAVDMVLSPKGIAKELVRITKSSVTVRLNPEIADEVDPDDPHFGAIVQLLYKSTGVDFKHYKKATIMRRITRRMHLQKLIRLGDYAKYLKQHTSEIQILYEDLLISVTSFFRDEPTTKYLKKELLPKIIKSKTRNSPIRIWVPGCASGEEPYSIAILILELLKNEAPDRAVQIFATDLSEIAIIKARAGIYSLAEITNVSPQRLRLFFTRIDGHYRILKSIRELCVFATHNVFKDAPFSRLDLICCCNLMIYLDTVLQKKVISMFHYALNPHGHLVLGKTESISAAEDLFLQADKKIKVYSKKDSTQRISLFDSPYSLHPKHLKPSRLQLIPDQKTKDNEKDLARVFDNILLTRYIPAAVIVTADLDILQFRGPTGLYLEPSPGKASLNLLKMARPGLGFELRSATLKAIKTQSVITKSNLEIFYKGNTHLVDLEVYPFKAEEQAQLLLITFRERMLPPQALSAKPKDKRAKQLEMELAISREDLRMIVEEHEAANEELQAANEEIVSSNEELQSINEELETSKEEVESANEELMTINNELLSKNEQLSESYEYTQAILDTIRESTMILDNKLRVKACNKTFFEDFKVTEEEVIGRLIYDLGNRQWDIPQLRELLEDIIPRNRHFAEYRVEHTFPGIGSKVMLLNARLVKIQRQQMVLIAFEDITDHERAKSAIAERELWFRNMANGSPVMIWVSNEVGQRTFFNKTWLEFTGKKAEEEHGMGWVDDIHPQDKAQFLRVYNGAYISPQEYRAEYRAKRKDGEYRWVMASAKPYYAANEKLSGFIGSVTEIHDQKLLQAALHEAASTVQTILGGLPQMAWMADAGGHLNFVNKGYMEYTGLNLQQALQKGSIDVIHPYDYEASLPLWLEHFKNGDPVELHSRYRRAADGEYRWHLIRAVPIKNNEDQITAWVGTNTDIHDEKLFSEELESQVDQRTKALVESNENLVRSNSELEQFAYVASHDLQEPLRKILTFSDRLKLRYKNQFPPEAGSYFDKIAGSAHRMSRLIEDLLNFSRVARSGNVFSTVDLNLTMHKVLGDFSLTVQESNARIDFTELPVIEAVPVQMTQLLYNLIGNALKFARTDVQVTVDVSARQLQPKDIEYFGQLNPQVEYIEMVVKDNGIGFNQEFAEQIFVIFQRLHDKQTYPGTGIGLALCRKIVNYHSGLIFARSRENEGAEFHVILPVRQQI